MTVRTIPLLSGYSTSNMTSPWVGPEMPRNLTDALVVVSVGAITGAPTAVTISPQFQAWHSVIGGNQEEVILGGTGVSPLNSWFGISAAQNPSLLPDGDWPAALSVAGATLTTPVAVFRTVRGGFPWRVQLAWAFTGGTTPAMELNVIAYCREMPHGGFDRVESSS